MHIGKEYIGSQQNAFILTVFWGTTIANFFIIMISKALTLVYKGRCWDRKVVKAGNHFGRLVLFDCKINQYLLK